MLADQVIAATRASTCAYNTVASKFVTNYRVDKIREGSSRSCSIIATILEPTNMYYNIERKIMKNQASSLGFWI